MPSYEIKYKSLQPWGVAFSRDNAIPLDMSSIFASKADAAAYAKGDGSDSRGIGGTAYVGQIITVYEEGEVSVYKIEENRTLGPIGGTDTIVKEYYEDLEALAGEGKLKVGQLVQVTNQKTPESPLAGFYIYNGASFDHLSVSSGQVNEVEAINAKLTSLENSIKNIDDVLYVVSEDPESGEKTLAFYTKEEVASAISEALQSYATTEALNNVNGKFADYTTTIDLNTLLAGKADKSDLTDLSDDIAETYATKDELSTGLNGKADNNHNHDGVYAKTDAFNELSETVAALPTAYSITDAGDGVYQLKETKKGETTVIGTINIPKDLVVSGGEVVDLKDGDVEGKAAGTYIKLTLANSTDVLYIPVNQLVDVYTGSDYINVNNYQISVDVDALAGALKDNSAITGKFATTESLNQAKADIKTAYEEYADTAAGNAKSDAIDHTNEALKAYATASEIANTYVANDTYSAKVQEIEGKANSHTSSIADINTIILDSAKGNDVLLERINTTDGNLSNLSNDVTKNAADILAVNSTVSTLSDAVVKQIVIGGSSYTPTAGAVTIQLSNDLSTAAENAIPSAKAVNDALVLVNNTIDNLANITIVDALPEVDEAEENIIYIVNAEGSAVTEQIVLDGKFYQLGSDTYARKDVMAVAHSLDENGEKIQDGRDGLMTADDKTLLYNIGAIDLSELNTLLQ
jgi:hypothetical protein